MESFLKTVSDTLRLILEYRLFSDITVASLFALLALFGIVVLGERILRRYFIMRVLKRTRLDTSLQFAVGRIIGYCVIALGFYVSFQMVGINLNSLAILAGAVGVGLGFGFQNIISNFVSGLIILAERPISIGDRIEVGGVAGQVREINLRSTTVETNDNISIIVPNADFITHTVTNWSHGDAKVRFRIPIGVAYGTDLPKLRQLMIEVGRDHPKALKHPAPELFFIGFGDSALNFELAVWTEEMTFSPRRFRSELNYAIENKLRENNIEIPFPQRDLHLRSGSFALPKAQAKS